MTPHEELVQRKAEFDQEIDDLLLHLSEEEMEFRQRILRLHAASQNYVAALTEAAQYVNREKGEAYEETAQDAVLSLSHFLRFMIEHRSRRRPTT